MNAPDTFFVYFFHDFIAYLMVRREFNVSVDTIDNATSAHPDEVGVVLERKFGPFCPTPPYISLISGQKRVYVCLCYSPSYLTLIEKRHCH